MGVSLGGLASGMDTGAIIEQLVALEKQPIYRYEDEISQLEKQKLTKEIQMNDDGIASEWSD